MPLLSLQICLKVIRMLDNPVSRQLPFLVPWFSFDTTATPHYLFHSLRSCFSGLPEGQSEDIHFFSNYLDLYFTEKVFQDVRSIFLNALIFDLFSTCCIIGLTVNFK